MPMTRKMRSRFLQVTGGIEIVRARKIKSDHFLDCARAWAHGKTWIGQLRPILQFRA